MTSSRSGGSVPVTSYVGSSSNGNVIGNHCQYKARKLMFHSLTFLASRKLLACASRKHKRLGVQLEARPCGFFGPSTFLGSLARVLEAAELEVEDMRARTEFRLRVKVNKNVRMNLT